MAGINASGLGGAGLDVNSLVSQLVAAERAPLQQRITRTETDINTKLNALGTIRSALSTLQNSLNALKTADAVQIKRATSSDDTTFRATASASAVAATYSVEVERLARADKRSSAPLAEGETAKVGVGTLTLGQAGQTFEVEVGAHTTLAELRDAINAAAGNTGVRAALLNTAAGTRLTLTSTQTGAAQSISMNATGSLNSFVNGFTVTSAAQDARVNIDGFEVTSAKNSVTGAISGVTIDLLAAKPSTTLTLTVAADVSATKERINKFITDFNAFQSQAARLRSYDSRTRTGGPLIGDSTLRSIESSLRREITTATESVALQTNSLSAIGIRFGTDGRLTVNDSTLTEAITNRGDAVAQMLTATDGLVPRLQAAIDRQIATDGVLTARTSTLDGRKRALDRDKEALEARMLLVEKRYRSQFINLDRMLSEMQGTSSYIAKIGTGR